MPSDSKRQNVLSTAEQDLLAYFLNGGCIRVPNVKRRKANRHAQDGHSYKKGYEIRFVAYSDVELLQVRRLLSVIGFKAGASFEKGRQIIQPVYGKAAVERWQAVVGAKHSLL